MKRDYQSFGIPKLVEPIYTNKDRIYPDTDDTVPDGEYVFRDETMPDGSRDSAPAIGGFICGILSLILCLTPIVPLVLGLVGIALSHENERQVAANRNYNTGTSPAGRMCAILGIVINLVVYAGIIIFFVVWMLGGV